MTRNEMLKAISGDAALATRINKEQGVNFTRCKTNVLEKYFSCGCKPSESNPDAYESAAISFLVTLEQKGVLDNLLAKIKG